MHESSPYIVIVDYCFPKGQMEGAPEPEDGVQLERICMDVDGADLPFSDKYVRT
jgi:hypothetical protein